MLVNTRLIYHLSNDLADDRAEATPSGNLALHDEPFKRQPEYSEHMISGEESWVNGYKPTGINPRQMRSPSLRGTDNPEVAQCY